jgi:hypothetical protein
MYLLFMQKAVIPDVLLLKRLDEKRLTRKRIVLQQIKGGKERQPEGLLSRLL